MSSKNSNGKKADPRENWSDASGKIKLALDKLEQDVDTNLAKIRKKGDDIRSKFRDMGSMARVVGRKD